MNSKLPNKLIFVPNPEKKGFTEHWEPGRNPLNFIHPFRVLLISRPGSGKTAVINNIIARIDPPFEKIYLFHCGGDYVKEYEDIDHIVLKEIPAPSDKDFFDCKQKTAFIIEDHDLCMMNKEQRRRLDRLLGYVSTHRNVSVFITAQDFWSIPPSCRRMANFYILWKTLDLVSQTMIARRIGFLSEELNYYINKYLTGDRDSLWLDLTLKTPYEMRKNGFEILQREKKHFDSNIIKRKKKKKNHGSTDSSDSGTEEDGL